MSIPPRAVPLALATLLLATPADASAQEPSAAATTVDLRGRITDGVTGMPLANAEVGFPNLDRMVVTDADGRFDLPPVAPGDHLFRVRLLGYEEILEILSVGEEASGEEAVLEISLSPDPVVLEGLEVMAQRLSRRARAAPVFVRTVERGEILRSAATDALGVLEQRTGLHFTSCPPSVIWTNLCVSRYGRRVRPTVVVDEVAQAWGVDALAGLPADYIHRIEVFDRSHIRVYTTAWARRTAESRPNLPWIRVADPHRARWRSSRGPGWN